MTLFIVTERNKQGLIRICESVTPECTPLECHARGDSIGGDRHSSPYVRPPSRLNPSAGRRNDSARLQLVCTMPDLNLNRGGHLTITQVEIGIRGRP